MTAALSKITKRVGPEQIETIIRDRICLRTYAPGAILHEGTLAEEFGVSRTPIREVLQRLSAAGLVEVKNGVGTIVTERTLEQVRQIYALRIKIAALIGDMSPLDVAARDIQRMEALLQRARTLAETMTEGATGASEEPEKSGEYWRINHEAHAIIGELIGNEPLREIWDRTYFQTASYWYGVVQSEKDTVAHSLCRELEDILHAMNRNDVAAIGFIERNFISYGLERVMAAHQVRVRD